MYSSAEARQLYGWPACNLRVSGYERLVFSAFRIVSRGQKDVILHSGSTQLSSTSIPAVLMSLRKHVDLTLFSLLRSFTAESGEENEFRHHRAYM